jgi:hypothetical protein
MGTNDGLTNSSTSTTLSALEQARMLLHIAIGKQQEANRAREEAEEAFRQLGLPLPDDQPTLPGIE